MQSESKTDLTPFQQVVKAPRQADPSADPMRYLLNHASD